MTFSYNQLRDAIAGNSVGVRSTNRLAPLGGVGDKVFPPTYSSAAGAKYAVEQRHINGETTQSVVLDSVASQSNRQELALLALKQDGASVPVVEVDFSETEVPDLGHITTLEASHRVFDALFRDSLNGELLFRHSEQGIAITEATPKNAAALLALSPTTLLFGGWDSTGPKGGLGQKYERAITSEIVANGIQNGSKTSSRLDVLGIEKAAGPIFEAEDDREGWTADESAAKKAKKAPIQVGSGTDLGRPSQIVHGNIVPSIDESTGGVTADEILATSVLSFAQLRRLRFPLDSTGNPLPANDVAPAEISARTALAALGLLATVATHENGYDLRSRCVLVAEKSLEFDLVGRTLEDVTTFSLTTEEALGILSEAIDELRSHGLQWNEQDLVLTPTSKLLHLVTKSRELSQAKSDNSDEE